MREALDALIQLAAYRHSTPGDQKSALGEIFTLPDERRSRWRRTGIRTLGPSSSKAGPRPRHDSAVALSGGQAGRPRARRGRDRGLGLDGFWSGSGSGEGDPVLERSRLFARDPDDELQPPPPPPHPRPHDGRPPDGAAALSCRGRGPALDEEGPRVRIL